MPRGHKKRGAWDCHIWFEDGCRYRLTNIKDGHTNAEIADSIRTNLLPMLDVAVASEKRRASATALDAVDPVDGIGQKGATRV